MRSLRNRPELKLEALDLRAVTRDSNRAFCYIQLDADHEGMKPWIECGRIEIQSRGEKFPQLLAARADYGVTDFEHDSAYIFRIPVVGVRLDMVYQGGTTLVCWIAGDADDLRVPTSSDYDPTKLPGAFRCTDCEKHHDMVPEGAYAGPPPDPKLFALLVGRRLEIRFGTRGLET